MNCVWRPGFRLLCVGSLALVLSYPDDASAGHRRRGLFGSFGSSGGSFGSSGGSFGSSGGSSGGSFGSSGGSFGSSGGLFRGLFGGSRGSRGSSGGFYGSSGGYYGSSGGDFGSSGGYYGRSGGYHGSSGGYYGAPSGPMYYPAPGDDGYDPGMDAPPPPTPPADARRHSRPNTSRVALLELKVPANAKVSLQGQPMALSGEIRRFVSPELEPDRAYAYSVEVEVERDGKVLSKTTQARVRAGQHVEVTVSFAEEKPDELVANVRAVASRQ